MAHTSKEVLRRMKTETIALGNELTAKISGFMIGGFSFVAGLAWNDAIKALIEYFFPLAKNTLIAQFVYAIVISIIVIIASVFILRATKRMMIEKVVEEAATEKTI